MSKSHTREQLCLICDAVPEGENVNAPENQPPERCERCIRHTRKKLSWFVFGGALLLAWLFGALLGELHAMLG